MKVLFASTNKGKIKEIKDIAKKYDIDIITPMDLGIDLEVEEVGNDFASNAILKAIEFKKYVNIPVIADDSGLCIDILKGSPDIYSHRIYDEMDTFKVNKLIASLLSRLTELERSAHYVSVAAYYDGKNMYTMTGRTNGFIEKYPKGSNGFAYDPIFFSYELKKTFGEATIEEKNSISHRSKAFNELFKYIKSKNIV